MRGTKYLLDIAEFRAMAARTCEAYSRIIAMQDGPTYIPEEDIYEALKDGSGRVCVARVGVPMPWSRAYALGLVKTEAPIAGFQIVTEPDGQPVRLHTKRGKP